MAKKRIASGKTSGAARARGATKVAMAATTGAASAVATVQQTQGQLQIASTSSAGTPGAKGAHEVVVVRWDGDQPLSLKGWQVRDKRADHAYTFGDVTLKPHSTIRVHGGGSASQDTETDVHWARAKDVWNKESDVVHLLDARGVLHAQYIFEAGTRRKTTKRKRKLTSSKKVAAKKKVAANQPAARKPSVKKTVAKKKAVKKKPVKTKRGTVKRPAMASAARAKKVTRKKRPASQRTMKKKSGGKLWIVAEECQFVGPKNDPEQEVVTIAWDGSQPLSLKGWTIYDSEAKHTYTFGDVTLKAESPLRLHTGGRDQVDTSNDVYWRQRNGVWNNEGDVVAVAEPSGKVQASYAYGGGATSAPKRKQPVAAKKKPKASPTPQAPRKRPAKAPPPQPVTEERATQLPSGEKPQSESNVAPEQPEPPVERPSVAKKAAPKKSRAKKKTSKVVRAKPKKAAGPSGMKKKEAPQSPPSEEPAEPSRIEQPTAAQTPGAATPEPAPSETSGAVARLSPSSQPDSQTQPTAPHPSSTPPSAEQPSPRSSRDRESQLKLTKSVVLAAFLGGIVLASIVAVFSRGQSDVSLSKANLNELASAQERAVEAAFKWRANEFTHAERFATVTREVIEREDLLRAMQAVEKSLERETEAETLKLLTVLHEKLFAHLAAQQGSTETGGGSGKPSAGRRPASAAAAIKLAIAAVEKAKKSRCSDGGHAQGTADIDSAIAAAKRAIVLLSDDDDD